MARLSFIVLALLTALTGEVRAHAITALSVVSDFKADGSYRLELGIDVKLVRDAEDPTSPSSVELRRAGESGVTVADPNAPLSEEEIEAVLAQVEGYIGTSLRFYFGEEKFDPAFEIEEAAAAATEGASPEAGEGEVAPMKRYVARGTGEIPGSAKEFLLEATPEAVAPVIFIIFRDGKPTRHSQVLYSGEFSRPVDLDAIRSGEALPGRKPQVEVEDRESTSEVSTSNAIEVEEAEESSGGEGEGGWGRDFQVGLGEGARQFVPAGLASTLFVIAFLILSWRFEMVFLQVVAFTVAHSGALALGALGMVAPSPTIVAGALGLSIAIVAVDNLIPKEPGGWRVLLVFVLGLAHGLGFGEAFLRESWVGPSIVPGLMGFNLGVEVGQLSVILVAMAALAWMRGWTYYRRFVVMPGSIVLAGMGIYLAVDAFKVGSSL